MENRRFRGVENKAPQVSSNEDLLAKLQKTHASSTNPSPDMFGRSPATRAQVQAAVRGESIPTSSLDATPAQIAKAIHGGSEQHIVFEVTHLTHGFEDIEQHFLDGEKQELRKTS